MCGNEGGLPSYSLPPPPSSPTSSTSYAIHRRRLCRLPRLRLRLLPLLQPNYLGSQACHLSLSAFSLNSTSNFTNLVADFVRPSYYDLLVHVNLKALRVGTLVSGLGSIMGCGFLTMALVNLVHIKLWDLSCCGLYTLSTIGPLVT
ncbi:hypothetical protein LINPERHAP2_LOCUS16046 [Linum perenne]